MSSNHDSLKLGKGKSFFVKSRLKRLRQEDETWEADFRALPKPIMQTGTHYLGTVLTRPHGFLLAHHEVEQTPTVNDLARMLAEAMHRPGTEDGPHRPRCIHVRGNPRWKELFPHLKELGIEVLVRDKLPEVNKAFEEFLQQEKKNRREGIVKPTTEQADVEDRFPLSLGGYRDTATSRSTTRKASALWFGR